MAVFNVGGMSSSQKSVARTASLRLFAALAVVTLALATPGVAAAPAAAARAASPPLAAEILTAPRPVPGTDGRTHLVYEILLRNDAGHPVRLDRVEVGARGVIAALDGDAIRRRLLDHVDGAFTQVLAPGRSGLLLLDVTPPPGARPPARLDHRFEVTAGGGAPVVFTGASVIVDSREPLRVSPPLRGGDLAVIGCCGPPFGHRLRSPVELDGRRHVAQRYAIDFVRVHGDGLNTSVGDPARNENYLIFGAAVVAAAPGRVIAVRDGVPENIPRTLGGDVYGNYVLQDLGGGRTAMYAHLRNGSVRVRPGDRVARGRVLGQVGNTGMSFEPHLHFHVTDGPGLPSGLTADGVPFVFDRFRLDARLAEFDPDPRASVRVPASPPHRRARQYPLSGDIVAFGSDGGRP